MAQQGVVTTAHAWLNLDDEVLATYNCFDTVETAKLIAPIKAELAARPGNLEFFEQEFWPTVPVIIAMTMRGIPIDLAERTRLRRQFRAEVRECDRRLCAAAGHPYLDLYSPNYDKSHGFKPNSDTHIRRWLFGGDTTRADRGAEVEVAKPKRKADGPVTVKCLGLQPALRTEGRKYSVAQDSLLSLLNTHWRKMDDPFKGVIHDLLHRARFVKLDEYLDFETDDRGDGPRVFPVIKPFGTKSLRLAYADPAVHSWAKELRSMIRARDGYVLVGADYSAIEARLAAYLSDDDLDIAVFERPDEKYNPDADIHSATTLECFKMTREEWAAIPNKAPYRDWAKQFRYRMLLYGGSAETSKEKVFCPCHKCHAKVPDRLALSRTEQGNLTNAWFARHHKFTLHRKKLLEAFGPHGTRAIKMPSGWRSPFVQPWSTELQREAFNRPYQHSAWWIVSKAEVALHHEGCPLIINHHDSLVSEVPEADSGHWLARKREVMEQPVKLEQREVRFPVDAKIGRTWADL